MSLGIWFTLPSLTAILIQAWLFIHSDKRTLLNKSRPLLLLLISLVGISFIEFSTYTQIITPNLLTMKLYYVSCFLGLTGILSQALKVSGLQIGQKPKLYIFLICLCFILSILMVGTNILVKGFEFISYSYTRIPGEFYWVVQIYLISMILFSIALLSFGLKNQNNDLNSKRAKVLLISIAPLLLIGLMLIPLMQFGMKINASIIFPLFISYFLVVLIQTEKEESLFAILIKLPFSKERESFKQITAEIQQFLINTQLSHVEKNTNNSLSLKNLTSSIENLIVEHTVEVTLGSQVKAASLLGISSSSLCRKKRKN